MKALETTREDVGAEANFGKYRLVRKLGAGGMAQIDLAAIDGPDGFTKTCVIKRILPQLASFHDFSEMFVIEAKIAALLNHPNVVQVFDFGRIDDQYYLAMEHVDGPSLNALIIRASKAKAALGPSMAVHLGIPLCDALHYVHSLSLANGQPLRLVHRDVTPGNVLISHSAEVKLTDFGVVKCASDVKSTQAGVVKGKLAYMSPEQAMGKSIDHRSDLFSLGVVLFEVATGRRLWKRGSPLEMLSAVSQAQVPRPTELIPGFPAGVERIILKALAKDPDRRYQSAAEMMGDLDAYRSSARFPSGRRELSSLLHTYYPDATRSNVYQFPTAAPTVPSAATVSMRPEDILTDEGDLPSISIEPEAPAPGLARQKRWILLTVASVLVAAAALGGSFLFLRRGPSSTTREAVETPAPAPATIATPDETPKPLDDTDRGLARAHRAAGLVSLEHRDYTTALKEFGQALAQSAEEATDIPELIRITSELQGKARVPEVKTAVEPEKATLTKPTPAKSNTRAAN